MPNDWPKKPKFNLTRTIIEARIWVARIFFCASDDPRGLYPRLFPVIASPTENPRHPNPHLCPAKRL
jgi:hypothetical protein